MVFLHIPKTAGTTLDALLRPHFGPAKICPERHGTVCLWPPKILEAFDYISAHAHYLKLARVLRLEDWSLATVMRAPVKRLLLRYVY